MPDPTTRPVLTAFEWVPEFARGLVRDLRVRWALEEIGRPYQTDLLNARQPRPEEYLARQPFDQVPAFEDGDLKIFETGAILLYLGEQDERLLPAAGALDRDRLALLRAQQRRAVRGADHHLRPVPQGQGLDARRARSLARPVQAEAQARR